VLLARNKSDLLPDGAELPLAGETPSVAVSALTGAGVAELREAILSLVTAGRSTSEPALLTSLRQQQAVASAVLALDRARGTVTAEGPHEVLLLDLYGTLEALDALTGVTTRDDILHLIFSRFCIGK
jgi:tRNA modification GTPase